MPNDQKETLPKDEKTSGRSTAKPDDGHSSEEKISPEDLSKETSQGTTTNTEDSSSK